MSSCEFCNILKSINYVQHLLKAVSKHRCCVYKNKRLRVPKQHECTHPIPILYSQTLKRYLSRFDEMAVPKWLDKHSCKIFKVCPAVLKYYVLKVKASCFSYSYWSPTFQRRTSWKSSQNKKYHSRRLQWLKPSVELQFHFYEVFLFSFLA